MAPRKVESSSRETLAVGRGISSSRWSPTIRCTIPDGEDVSVTFSQQPVCLARCLQPPTELHFFAPDPPLDYVVIFLARRGKAIFFNVEMEKLKTLCVCFSSPCLPRVGLTSGVAGVVRVLGGHPLDAAEQDHFLTLVAHHRPLPADHHVAHGKGSVDVVDLGTSEGAGPGF